MSEMEIKQLTQLQSKISDFIRTLESINRSITLYADGTSIFKHYAPLNLHAKVQQLMKEEYENEISKMRFERDQLVICTSQTKTSYKPIDILDRE
jgi:hypothetical protein